MRNTKWILIPGAVALVGIFMMTLRQYQKHEVGPMKMESDNSRGYSSLPLLASESTAAVQNHGAKGGAASGAAPLPSNLQMQEAVGKFAAWNDISQDVETRVESEQDRKKLFDLILQDASAGRTASSILLAVGKSEGDIAFAKARVMAVATLTEMLRRNHGEDFHATVNALVTRLWDQEGALQNPAVSQDLRDLITNWIEIAGKEQFRQHPETLMKQYFAGREFNRPQVEFIYKAIWNVMGEEVNRPPFSEKLKNLLARPS